jgi:hypothetical protein
MPVYLVADRCSICGKPITDQEIKMNEFGGPVHVGCYVEKSKTPTRTVLLSDLPNPETFRAR